MSVPSDCDFFGRPYPDSSIDFETFKARRVFEEVCYAEECRKRELDADAKRRFIEAIRVMMLESGRSVDACWQFMEKLGCTTKYIVTIIMEAKLQLHAKND